MKFKGVLGKMSPLEITCTPPGASVEERVLFYTGRRNYDEDALRLYDEAYMHRLYDITRKNVVNVGTVGHMDIAGDWDGNQQYIRRKTNPFTPEWIYWWNGLIYVGGRVIHNLRIYEEVESPKAEDALIVHEATSKGHSKEYDRLKELLVSRMKMGTVGGKMMPTEVVAEIESFLRPQPMKVRPMLIIRELERDRRTVIPSRKAIQWAIEMTHWKDKDLFKILGMGKYSPEELAKLRWERKDA